MALSTKNLAKWEKIRKGGLLRFVLLWGVLFWGLGTAILYSLFMSLVAHVDFLGILPISLIAFPIGGIFFGLTVWWLSERKYKQITSARDW